MQHRLEVDGTFLNYGDRKILSDIYLKCETGQVTGLLGRNGSGKSSLIKIMYGTLPVIDKSIRFDGNSILSPYKRPDLLLYLPQHNFIPNQLTLERIFSDFELNLSSFEELFPDFGSKYKNKIKSLSGGEKRLIELYIIIKAKSQFSILDEPFTHLSPLIIEKIKKLIIKEKQNKGILITDHMYRDIIEVSDSLYLLVDGKTYLTKSIRDLENLGYVNF